MNGFNPYTINPNIERLKRQRDEIDNMLATYQQQQTQQPINNFINTQPTPQISTQQPQQDIISMRVLNEGEDVSNLFVQNKTIFLNEKNMIVKSPDGKLEKYDISKTYPIDPKDQKISELEKQIQELKGMIANEHSKSNKSVEVVEQSNANDNGNVESTTKTSRKQFSAKTE